MKAILEFNLDTPEGRIPYDIHFRALAMSYAHDEFATFLRRIDKYEEFTEEQLKVIDRIRARFTEIFVDV